MPVHLIIERTLLRFVEHLTLPIETLQKKHRLSHRSRTEAAHIGTYALPGPQRSGRPYCRICATC
jgi:hypothetical protein